MTLFKKNKKSPILTKDWDMFKDIDEFKKSLEITSPQYSHEAVSISQKQFILLLSGISTCRKIPGVNIHMGYESLYHCVEPQDISLAREHLKNLFDIYDKESLYEVSLSMYKSGAEWDQFLASWKGEPIFDEGKLTHSGRNNFKICRNYAHKFQCIVEDRGFFAWDCNEQIGLYRKACACGLITDDEFWQFSLPLAQHAASLYSSWTEFALSCLCGGLYFMFCENESKDESLKGFFDINIYLITGLFSEKGAWARHEWFKFPEKTWAIPAEKIKPLLTGWRGPEGCFATDRIMVDGCKVGYMYREKPDSNRPDSGWRFFAGDESEDYVDNPDNLGVYALNTVCNYDPDIIPLLKAPCGTAYLRDRDDTFIEDIPISE